MTYVQQLYDSMEFVRFLWLAGAVEHSEYMRRLAEYNALLTRYGVDAVVKVPYMVAAQFLNDLRELAK